MKTALLIINFGGPQEASEVESFLYELFRDKDVIPLPGGAWLQELFARQVSRRRAPKIIAQYEQIGGGSPLFPMTVQQAEALHRALMAEGHELTLHLGMRYTRPTVLEALGEIKAAGAERIICLALYPHFSFATTGSSYNEVARGLAQLGMSDLPVTFVPAWHDDPDYLAAMAELVRSALAKVPEGATPHLLFSAPGLPVSFSTRGDPYQAQVQQTVRDVVKALGWEGTHSLAFQSRVGPERWLSPATDEELERLAAAGVEDVVVVPVSFVGEHIETLFELDIEYRHVAEQAGIRSYTRAPALDLHPRFIACLATQVRRALAERHRPCVRCLLPKDDTYHRQATCMDCQFQKPAYLAHLARPPER